MQRGLCVLWIGAVIGAAAAQSGAAVSRLRHVRSHQAADQGDPYAAGCARLAAGDATGAVELLSRAVQQSPQRIECRLKLAEAYVADGRAEAAVRLLERALDGHPRDFGVRIALARCVASADPSRVVELLAEFEEQLDASGVLLLAEARRQAGGGEGPEQWAATLARGLKRFATDASLHLAKIDRSLAEQRYAGALREAREALRLCGPRTALQWRAARAYFALGEYFGDVSVETIPDGREGQFMRDRLLIEQREGKDRFLCCGERSALYQLRRALDAGLDTPAAHLMHAQIWQRMDKPRVGYGIIKRREALLLENADGATLEIVARLAFEADELGDFARYARAQARLDPGHSRKVLIESYLQLANRYNQRGDARMYVTCLERAARLAPADVDLAYRLGEACWDAGRREGAIESFHRVLELNPEHPQRGRIIERMGQWQDRKPDPGQ